MCSRPYSRRAPSATMLALAQQGPETSLQKAGSEPHLACELVGQKPLAAVQRARVVLGAMLCTGNGCPDSHSERSLQEPEAY